MRLLILLLWGFLVAGLGVAEAQAHAELGFEDQLTQGQPASAAPIRVDPGGMPQPDLSRHSSSATEHRAWKPIRRDHSPRPAHGRSAPRWRPWRRHGAHIPRMGDEPPEALR